MVKDTKLRHHLRIFLIKKDRSTPSKIFKAPSKLNKVSIPKVGTLYYTQSYKNPPQWLKLFDILDNIEKRKLFNSSTRAVLIVEESNRRFALAFGYGRYLLQEGAVEPRFGLRLTLNIMERESLRSIDTVSISSVPLHSKQLLSRRGSISDFGLNFDEDLVRAVAGKAADETFGSTVAGADVFATTIACELGDLKPFLRKCLTQSRRKQYLELAPWIDDVQEVSDRPLETALDERLISQVAEDDTDKIWLAVPEVVDWSDIGGFRYTDDDEEESEDDMSLSGFLNSFQRHGELSLNHFKRRSIYAVRAASGAYPIEWSAYRCLYAEIEYERRRYLLTGGVWYEIDSDYVSEIEEAYRSIPEAGLALPPYVTSRYTGIGEGRGEAGYNHDLVLADAANRLLLDRKLIPHGGGRSTIEFCDVLTRSRQLIHIKRYGGSSSLSHHFEQGAVSSELFRQDHMFREKVNELLPTPYKLSDPQIPPRDNEYEIVFVVINNTDRELDLPFFSKITLRATARRLQAYGYRVAFQRVPARP